MRGKWWCYISLSHQSPQVQSAVCAVCHSLSLALPAPSSLSSGWGGQDRLDSAGSVTEDSDQLPPCSPPGVLLACCISALWGFVLSIPDLSMCYLWTFRLGVRIRVSEKKQLSCLLLLIDISR